MSEAVAPPPVQPAVVTPPVAGDTGTPAVVPPVAPKAEAVEHLMDWLTTGGSGRKPKKPSDEPKPVDDKKKETVPEEAKPPDEKPVEGDAPEPKPAKGKVRTRHVLTSDQPAADPGALAKSVADGVADGVKKVMETVRTKEASAAGPKIPEMFVDKAEEFEALEKLHPKRYGDGKLVAMLVKSAKKIDSYQSTWEEQNPGKQFNPDEHRDEIDDLLPDIDQDHVVDAKVQIRLEKGMRPMQEKLDKQNDQIETSNVANTVLPQAKEAVKALGQSLIAEAAPELHKLLTKGDGEGVAKFAQENAEVLGAVNDVLLQHSDEAERAFALMSPGGERLVDRDKPSQMDIKILNHLIPGIEAGLEGKQDDAGIEFIPYKKYKDLPASEKPKYRFINREVVQAVIRQTAIGAVKQKLTAITDHEAAVLKKFGYAIPNGKVTKKEVQESAQNGEVKPTEKSTSSASGVSTSGGGPAVRPTSVKGDSTKDSFGTMWKKMSGIS